jgi:amino acid permease
MFVLITAAIAYFVPYFAQFMTLVGALCITVLVFVFPVIFLWKLTWPSLSRWEVAFGVLVMVVGLLGGGIGVYQAIDSLVYNLVHNVSPNS